MFLLIDSDFFSDSDKIENSAKEELVSSSNYLQDISVIPPLPQTVKLDNEKVKLGSLLFHEPKLSRNNSISCASCHNLSLAGTDRKSSSVGVNNLSANSNSPTVFNSVFNFSQFWDGRANTLTEQVSFPIHDPMEMDTTWADIIAKLTLDPVYLKLFKGAYDDGINSKNIINAIVTFEKSLVTPNSAFDQYLRGDKHALNTQQLKGLQSFKEFGCISCHQGINIGGNMFQKFGVAKDYFESKQVQENDLGRFNITKREEDRHVFKVPSLRNVAVTQPYFHDGSIRTLADAVKIMGEYQLGQKLSDQDVEDLTVFLESLTGQWQGEILQ